MDFGRHRFTGDSFYSNDLYAFNLKTKTWSEIRPDTSTERPSIQMQQQQQQQQQHEQNDPTLNHNEALLSQKFSPCGRRSHSAVVYKSKILVFGGYQENLHRHYNDLYEFDTGK